jgi:ribose 5-phosphate isomerase A
MEKELIKSVVAKQAVADNIQDKMKIGLGTGSTAVKAIQAVGEMYCRGEISGVVIVPTSMQTILECHRYKLPLRDLNDPAVAGELDLVIDGADEVDDNLRCTKGGGGALLLEKIIAYAAGTFLILIDYDKRVSKLGTTYPVPVEVVSAARVFVTNQLKKLGADPQLRMAKRKMGPVITENGNLLLDVTFPGGIDPVEYELLLNGIPGVVENGLFTRQKPTVYCGNKDGSVEVLSR